MEVGYNVKDLAHLQERYGPFLRILEKPEIDCVGSYTADCLDFIMWILIMVQGVVRVHVCLGYIGDQGGFTDPFGFQPHSPLVPRIESRKTSPSVWVDRMGVHKTEDPEPRQTLERRRGSSRPVPLPALAPRGMRERES